MKHITSAEYLEIPKALLATNAEYRIKAALTFEVPDGAVAFGGSTKVSEGAKVVLWRERDDLILVPRHFDYKPYVKGKLPSVVDARSQGTFCEWDFKFNLISKEGKDQKAAVAALDTSECGGILAAGPGKGKTIMAIAVAHRLKRQALVIVPNNFLLEQWVDRIISATSLTHADVGIIQEDRADFNKPLVVGMLPTLAQRDYPKGLCDRFGIVFVDECHRIGAPESSKALPKFAARYRFGLSATVDRKDGMDKTFRMHLGGVLYEMLQPDLKPTIFRLKTGIVIPMAAYTNRWNGELNIAKLHTLISEHARRNNILADEIVKAFRAGRKILGLSKRTEQLVVMRKLLVARGVPNAAIGTLVGKTIQKKMDPRPLAEIERCMVILGNEKTAGEGMDIATLDTLCLMMPMQNMEQFIGRIQRELPDKKNPLVIDPVDDSHIYAAMAGARKKVYIKYGFQIVEVDKRGAGLD